jgi:hypothetical protein
MNEMLAPPPKLGPPSSYLMCIWHAAEDDEPVWFWDELDESRWVIRCVRKYGDGRIEAYSHACANWRDVMPEAPVPSVPETNRDTAFEAREISKAEFEAVWRKACMIAGRGVSARSPTLSVPDALVLLPVAARTYPHN